MNTVATPRLRKFAVLLLKHEVSAGNAEADQVDAALMVCDKLRRSLSALAGVTGYSVLLARVLALAQAEAPWLGTVRVNSDGSLGGFLEATTQLPKEEVLKGGILIIANLIGLLVAFLGENLALTLVRRVWPAANFPEEKRQDEQTS